MNESLNDKLYNLSRPKRILSLDGGGIRGALTLGMLKKIETLLRAQTGDNNLVLGKYYDLISGTSTGAIIASGLAVGKTVDEIIQLYLNLGSEIFGKGRKHKLFPRGWTTMRAIFNENYSSKGLEKYLEDVFGDITIGDQEKLFCGLAINTKRADTYSLWTVANHPGGKYYDANSILKIWQLCRASSAAPYYFRPKKLNLRSRKDPVTGQYKYFDATFIDGGVSLANNPAWVTFLTAIVPTFGFGWAPGEKNILITTLGTGNGQTKENPDELEKLKAIGWASKLSDLFMIDASEMNQATLELFGRNAGGKFAIDSQFEDLDKIAGQFTGTTDPPVSPTNKLFTFQRHNVSITEQGLTQLGYHFTEAQVKALTQMDYHENVQTLLEIGSKYAEQNIQSTL